MSDAASELEKLRAGLAAQKATKVRGFDRRKPVRKPFPEHLPRERVVAEAPSTCTCGGSGRTAKMGEDINETPEVIPRQWKVIQTVREKFTCRDCEKISQPPVPFHPIPQGRAGPSLMAMIVFEKFGQHQPLNRQADRYAREGVGLSLSTLADLVGAVTELLTPLHALFEIERDINSEAHAARLEARQRLSAPLVADQKSWLRGERALLSKHARVAKAIDYLLSPSHWPGFTRFLEDGRICLTNNAAERSLRGVALGRKSWLFAGSERGGQRAAAMYTLIATAKLNGIDPQAWLADVIARISDTQVSRLHELLPWGWNAAEPKVPLCQGSCPLLYFSSISQVGGIGQ